MATCSLHCHLVHRERSSNPNSEADRIISPTGASPLPHRYQNQPQRHLRAEHRRALPQRLRLLAPKPHPPTKPRRAPADRRPHGIRQLGRILRQRAEESQVWTGQPAQWAVATGEDHTGGGGGAADGGGECGGEVEGLWYEVWHEVREGLCRHAFQTWRVRGVCTSAYEKGDEWSFT